jgi:hypothetical protein
LPKSCERTDDRLMCVAAPPMIRFMRVMAIAVAACAVMLSGCGSGLDGSATDAERAKVERYLRDVRDVACTHPKGATQCEVRVRKAPVGVEKWSCEFVFHRGSDPDAYSGADSCWTEEGSPDNVRGGQTAGYEATDS